VIAVMGQPEDYIIEEDNTTAAIAVQRKTKKNYTEIHDHGVSAGLGHYFGIDAVWVRILFILGVREQKVLAYIILWIVVPAAVTTSEKLEMTGEPVNISNIEKVKEEFENVLTNLKMLITINTGTK
jgi:phage shock protein PspC (stress-responsive transcriptional regulator)